MTWPEIVDKFPEANFLQSPEYGRMNALLGAKVCVTGFGDQGWAQAIVRAAKRGRYLEIPCGPLVDWSDPQAVKSALADIRGIAENENCAFVRLRPQLLNTEENLQMLQNLGLRKSPMHLAAEHTVMLDLTLSEEQLLANMRRQTRYEVRRALKQGIIVSHANSEAIFTEFHQVQAETARRQNFVPPSLETLQAERKAFGDSAQIYRATTPDGQPIAYGLIIGAGREAAYYEAASTELNHRLPGAYALLWQATQDLKAQGYERFNLWGIAPAGQPHHRYAGVTTFKTGFGGDIVEYVPAHDLIISHLRYLPDLVVETIRKKRRHL